MRSNLLSVVSSLWLTVSLLAGLTPAWAGERPAPEWIKQIAPGNWAAVSLNTLSDVDPAKDPEINPNFPRLPPWSAYGQRPVLNAWNGGAFASGYGEHGALLAIGGGHTDYYGNELYAFDLTTRRWSRLTNPYPTPVFPVADGIWPDGTPSVAHTYDQIDYHPSSNSLVMMKSQYDNKGGNNTPIVFMMPLDELRVPASNADRDFNKGKWLRSVVNSSNHANAGGWSAYDSRRDLFWMNGGGGTGNTLASFDLRTTQPNGTRGAFANYPRRSDIVHGAAAYDPGNDIILFTEFRKAPDIWAVDLSQPATGRPGNVKILQTGTVPLLEQSHGWEWSPTRRAFLYYRRGSGVYELKQQGSDWRASNWKWSELTSPGNTVIPEGERSNSTNGVFSKFRIATFDDCEIALVVSEVDQAVYAFRVPSRASEARPGPPEALSAH